MPPVEAAIVALEVVLAVAALLGLVVTGQWRRCLAFPIYLLCFVVSETAVLVFPDRFFVLTFWLGKEAVQGLVKLGLASELAYRLFVLLPEARRCVSHALLFIVVAMGLAIAPFVGDEVPAVVKEAMPRLLYGTAAAFTAVVAAALWYHVPVPRLHKVLLAGFSIYLVAFSAILHALQTWGWDLRGAANWINSAAFIAVLAFWASAAWRRSESMSTSPEVVARHPLWAIVR